MSATPQQLAAIGARGNVLVAAGAGTGKTSTVAERCLDLIVNEQCALEQILMVTFTEAAAGEMRARIRGKLQERADAETPGSKSAVRLAGEMALIETAPISTLHSFCLNLVRKHFHALGLDPQFTVLDESQTKPLVHTVLDALLERHYAARNSSSGLRELVSTYGHVGDKSVREIVVAIHRHAQALANPAQWFASQTAAFEKSAPDSWRSLLTDGVLDLAKLWRADLEQFAAESPNVAEALAAVRLLTESSPSFDLATVVLARIHAADADMEWKRGTKTTVRKALEKFFDSAVELTALARNDGAGLAEDWEQTRHFMLALLRLAREFTRDFSQAKRELGGIDFADQEQLALSLLYDDLGALTPVALACREQFRFVFVDECQDINAAQDAIIRAVSRDGLAANRFLVGDVKQSIYRFRLADPRIFQSYESAWRVEGDGGENGGRVLPLSENFRSHESVLEFINPVFRTLMRPAVGGLAYDAGAELQFGDPNGRAPMRRDASTEARVELHVLTREMGDSAEGDGGESGAADLQAAEREALLIAARLKSLKESGCAVWNRDAGAFVPVEYRDMVVLMRAVGDKAEMFAKAFHQAGVPLQAERSGFLDALEITDLLSLLKLLDNPLQDVPLLAVLHSPLVGMTPEELAQLRVAKPRGLLWDALLALCNGASGQAGSATASTGNAASSAARKCAVFLDQWRRWRERVRHFSLTHCIECALVETHYEAMLLAGERGVARVANVRRFVELARRFDPLRREGLYRFLQFIQEQQEREVTHRPAATTTVDAVRLMTVHASKGLEFPVVALAGLGSRFNLRELGSDILLHEELGLCPKNVNATSRRRYATVAHWSAAQRERRALLGEEMRLLYVALTRARDRLILTGSASRKNECDRWKGKAAEPVRDLELLGAGHCLEWLRLWFVRTIPASAWSAPHSGESSLLRWTFHNADAPEFLSLARSQTAESQDQAGRISDQMVAPTPEQRANIGRLAAFRYAHQAATIEPAKSSVSALRRRALEADEDARVWFGQTAVAAPRRRSAKKSTGLSAALIGTAHHVFMQLVTLSRAADENGLRAEADRLRAAGALTADEVAALDFPALERFWCSAVGKSFRAQPAAIVHREMPFTARMSARDLRALGLPVADGVDAAEFFTIQGAVDLAAVLPGEIWILDFKTDDVPASETRAKAVAYESQLKLYALALARIFRRPVTRCWLHFVRAGESIPVTVPAAAMDAPS